LGCVVCIHFFFNFFFKNKVKKQKAQFLFKQI